VSAAGGAGLFFPPLHLMLLPCFLFMREFCKSPTVAWLYGKKSEMIMLTRIKRIERTIRNRDDSKERNKKKKDAWAQLEKEKDGKVGV
jgi:hypothetical protein